jgi:hypothetical protein
LQKTELNSGAGPAQPEAAEAGATFFVGEGVESKQCARCTKIFYVTSEGQYLTKEGCTYHWGKLRARKRKDRWPSEDDRFTCCGAPASEATRGCCTCRVHVWRHLTEPGMHGPLDGFVRTRCPIMSFFLGGPGGSPSRPSIFFQLFFLCPITLLTRLTGISLHMQSPLTSQSHGSLSVLSFHIGKQFRQILFNFFTNFEFQLK